MTIIRTYVECSERNREGYEFEFKRIEGIGRLSPIARIPFVPASTSAVNDLSQAMIEQMMPPHKRQQLHEIFSKAKVSADDVNINWRLSFKFIEQLTDNLNKESASPPPSDHVEFMYTYECENYIVSDKLLFTIYSGSGKKLFGIVVNSDSEDQFRQSIEQTILDLSKPDYDLDKMLGLKNNNDDGPTGPSGGPQ